MQAALKLRAISQKLRFSFRRKAQVRTYLLFIFTKSVPCKGDTTRWEVLTKG